MRTIRCLTLLLCVFGLAGQSATANLKDGLVAYYQFEGDLTDASGNGHDAVAGGNGTATFAEGFFGQAVDTRAFGVDCGPLDPADEVTEAMSASCWAHWQGLEGAAANWQGVLAKRSGWGAGITRWWIESWSEVATAGLSSHADDGGGGVGSFTLIPDEWQHIAFSFDGTNAALYHNGQQVGSGAWKLGPDKEAHLTIGIVQAPNASPFNGTIDEVAFWSRGLSEEEMTTLYNNGEGISITGPKTIADKPSPEDGATDVTPLVILGWEPATTAATRDVYLGTNWEDVNSASADNPLDVLVSPGQEAVTYDPGRLALDTTYYWRIDEVNGTADQTVFRGDIWSFTVEPVSYVIPLGAVTATASSMDPDQDVVNTVNGSGLSTEGQHGTGLETMWVAEATDTTPWIQFDLDQVYKLDKVHVWNHNTQTETVLGFGIKEALIEISLDGETWSEWGRVEIAQATALASYAGTDIALGGIVAQHVRITALSNYSLLGLPQKGLSEVRFYSIPAVAREPMPADGSTSDSIDVTLEWRTGREAVEHEVVFSTDEQAVIDGSAVVATVSTLSHDPGTLDLGLSYFWKVNEMNDLGTPPVYEGDMWAFQTPDQLMIEDFEMYQAEEGLRIWEYWLDGFENQADNGAIVGDGDEAEKRIIYEGKQSMPIAFDNTVAPTSEVARVFDAPLDLTRGNPENLKLQIHGDAPEFVENADGTLTIGAAGRDIWDTADDFRLVYKRLSGDGSITAKVNSVVDVDEWVKAGVMIRENLAPDAINAFSFCTPQGRTGTQWRVDDFDVTVSTRSENNGTIALPYWIRLTRTGNMLKGEQSADGVTWLPMISENIPEDPTEREVKMISDVYVGLAVTSHVTGTSTVAVFSDVTTTGAVTGPWIAEAIGADEHPNNQAAPMYLVLADTAGKEKTIDHPDPAATLNMSWDEWTIPMGDLSGMDVTQIDSITVGVGSSGVQGKVYIDAIRTDRTDTGDGE